MNKTVLQIDNISLMEGDIFQTKQPTLVCTVNTEGVMGKGIALAVRNRWPEVYDQYRNHCVVNPHVSTMGFGIGFGIYKPNLHRGGDIAHCPVDNSTDSYNPNQLTLEGMEVPKPTDIQEVLCMATKEKWREPSRLDWIKQGVLNVYVDYEPETTGGLAFPMIGCGNGGLQWKDVYPIMMKYLSQLKVPVEIYVSPQEFGRMKEWVK